MFEKTTNESSLFVEALRNLLSIFSPVGVLRPRSSSLLRLVPEKPDLPN